MTTPLEQLHKPINLHALPSWRARVEIAKDVLAALDLNVFQPVAHSAYLFADVPSYITDGTHCDLREAFGTKTFSACQVCGIGALFVAKVARLNAVAIPVYKSHVQVMGAFVRHQLVDFFSPQQLALIECAFEYSDSAGDSARVLSWDEAGAASDFGNEYFDDTIRMRAIMKNIIRNKGEFKP